MDEEKPVWLIGSPMCQTFCDLIMLMRDPNGQSEVKYENLVERCMKHPKEKGIYEIQRNVRRLFLHANLWERWSRGLGFVKEMAERNGVHKTESELCGSQLTKCFPKRESCFKSKSEYVIGELQQR